VKKLFLINIRISSFLKLVILLALLCKAGISSAQDDTVVIAEPPVAEETNDNTNQAEESESSFKQKTPGEDFSVSQRNVSGKAYKELKSDDAFWYVDYKKAKDKTKIKTPEGQKGENGQTATPSKEKDKQEKKVYKEEAPEYTPVVRRGWFKTLMLLIAIVGFAVIIGWYLASSNVGFFRKKDVKETETLLEEEMPVDIFAINYQKEIDKAAAEGNYRLAIRLQYLRLLKQLTEKNIIQYKQDKTNFDYISELHSTPYYNQFFRITRNYEYSWYGRFDVSGEAYRLISLDVEQLGNQMVYAN
jgi:hypothetical protein